MRFARQCPVCGWHPTGPITHLEAARAHTTEVGGFKARRHHRKIAKQAAARDTWNRILRRSGQRRSSPNGATLRARLNEGKGSNGS